MSIEKEKLIAEELLMEETMKVRRKRRRDRYTVAVISICWVLFQLALPKFILLDTIVVRAVHLAFAMALVYLTVPMFKKNRKEVKFLLSHVKIPLLDYILAFCAVMAVLYIVFDWNGIAARAGRPLPRDIVFGAFLLVLLFEASRRIIGPALGIIALIFSIYAFLGPWMPGFLAFRGVSLVKYVSKICLSTEGIYGIPLDVSATTVFLFVLLGSMLDKVGAGHFFNDLSLALLGKYKGGPAKASVVSSGLTGLVSGSSIANVVTTGTFTIPLMKKVGYPAKIAAATEVAASTNGQLMPPIMGAAAFIIAEYLGTSYMNVIKAAALPAFVSYFALFYITHLEACRLDMKGLPAKMIPNMLEVLKKGFYYLIPLAALIIELMVFRHTPKLAAFNAILILILIIILKEIIRWFHTKEGTLLHGIRRALKLIIEGFSAGAHNMLSVALATATAGIVVGIITMGIGSMVVYLVEVLSAGNIFLLLFITAIASLVLGMGLPTTATYIVMASITVPIIVKLSAQFGMNPIPPIAAHLFCFYFGILADDTPPVGLAAYTAAAIAKSDPIQTGLKGFLYDLRTAIIPFMFIFNPELLLVGVGNVFQGIMIFIMAIPGMFAFTNAVQGWFLIKNRWYEVPFFLLASLLFFYPGLGSKLLGVPGEYRYLFYFAGAVFYVVPFIMQKIRMGKTVEQV